MKLILSRKGFDSTPTSGGGPSPVFDDGLMLSLPIPGKESPIRYKDIRWRDGSLGDLVEKLSEGKVPGHYNAHLDPDLVPESIPRSTGWRPVFGQRDRAQGHLRNQGIAKDDLFLFWGLFQRLNDNMEWVGARFHAIWGWLLVGDLAAVDAAAGDPNWAWSREHPHYFYKEDRGTLYAASSRIGRVGPLTMSLPGSGAFKTFDPVRRLTAPGETRATQWELPVSFLPQGRPPLTYTIEPGRLSSSGDRVRVVVAPRGQEMVLDLDQYPEVAEWVVSTIRSEAL